LQIAFGLDLSPLAREMPQITAHAATARKRAETLSAMRCHLGALRAQIIARCGHTDLTDAAAKILKRKPVADDIVHASRQCEAILADDPSGTDAQNERHIQTKSISKKTTDTVSASQATTPSLHQITGAFLEYQCYFPNPVRHWQDLSDIAFRLTTMIGIDRGVFQSAIRDMGERWASIAVLSIIENLCHIANPGGYLRGLAHKARAGVLRIDGLMVKLGENARIAS